MIWIVEDTPRAERKPEPARADAARRVRAQVEIFTCSTARLRRVELALFGVGVRRRR